MARALASHTVWRAIPVRDRDFFDAVNDTAQAIRDLVEMVEARRAG